MVAQIWLCIAEKPTQPLNMIPQLLQPLLAQYASVFESSNELPPARKIDHRIPLVPNYKPINIRPYRYSYFQKLELEKIIAKMLQSHVIRPSTSPFASPALLVKKKDGS
jgi:hypothetical protein